MITVVKSEIQLGSSSAAQKMERCFAGEKNDLYYAIMRAYNYVLDTGGEVFPFERIRKNLKIEILNGSNISISGFIDEGIYGAEELAHSFSVALGEVGFDTYPVVLDVIYENEGSSLIIIQRDGAVRFIDTSREMNSFADISVKDKTVLTWRFGVPAFSRVGDIFYALVTGDSGENVMALIKATEDDRFLLVETGKNVTKQIVMTARVPERIWEYVKVGDHYESAV